MNDLDTELQKDVDEQDFEAWQDEHAPEHYEPDWEPVDNEY